MRLAAKLLVVSAPARSSTRLAWLASLSVLAACFGGPTSDFPNRGTGEAPTHGGGADNGDNNNNGGDSEGANGGGASSGSNGAPGLDAGTAAPPDSSADAAVPPVDGAVPCTWSTSPADAASCGGSHCLLTRAELTATPSAVCEPAGSLDAVCSGDAQRVVHACWRSNMSTADRAVQVKVCAVADPLLVNMEGACVDCYVALHECISASCEAACATEANAACELCTSEMCTPAFATCSGLTAP